jgi:hypothetical protein
MIVFRREKGGEIYMRGLSIAFISIALLANFSCMDPNEYKPEDPPQKIDPPEAPSVLLPVQDTLFRCEYSRWVTLDWTAVDGAEGYEFGVDTDSGFASSLLYQGYFPPTSFSAVCFPPITTYFFRVRAYSDAWTWYTEWSELRRFHVMPVEDDTIIPIE